MNDKEAEGLDHKEINKHGSRLFSMITKIIIAQERSKEMTCGAIVALANMLVIMIYTLIKDKDRAMEVLTTVISKAIKDYEVKKAEGEGGIIVCEISLDPETPGK
jgi:D-serine deaminase-like pyridoxal phosphate-dependent protein